MNADYLYPSYITTEARRTLVQMLLLIMVHHNHPGVQYQPVLVQYVSSVTGRVVGTLRWSIRGALVTPVVESFNRSGSGQQSRDPVSLYFAVYRVANKAGRRVDLLPIGSGSAGWSGRREGVGQRGKVRNPPLLSCAHGGCRVCSLSVGLTV